LKIIWVYENINKQREDYSKFNTLLMLASVSLWKRNHPEDDTWLYCDELTHSLITELGVQSLYDNIEIIDFNDRPIDKTNFWASSKLQVLALQTEPVIIMDCDTLVFKPFKHNIVKDQVLFSNREFGRGYYPTSLDPLIRGLSYKPRWKTESVNVSFLYLPDPVFTQEYANLSLKLMEEFTVLKAPNSRYLIFAEQLLLKHLLVKNKVEHRAVISTEWDCNNWKWSNVNSDGIWTIEDSWQWFRHYGPLKKWYKTNSPDHPYDVEIEMLRNCINFHKFIDLSSLTKK
jgi:hypothetical protein